MSIAIAKVQELLSTGDKHLGTSLEMASVVLLKLGVLWKGALGGAFCVFISLPLLLQGILSSDAFHEHWRCHIEITEFLAPL